MYILGMLAVFLLGVGATTAVIMFTAWLILAIIYGDD